VGDDVTKKLREQVGSMTTRDWLVRVSELRQAVENRDRVLAEQRRTIERLRALLTTERAKTARLEAELAKSGAPTKAGSKPRQKPNPTGEASS
jgi:hypothetical protein